MGTLDEAFLAKFEEMFTKVSGIEKEVHKITGILERVEKLETENKTLKRLLGKTIEENRTQNERIRELEQYSRKRNIIMNGLKPATNESTRAAFHRVTTDIQIEINAQDINAFHTLPSKEGKFPTVIICLNSMEKKDQLIRWSKTNKKNRSTSKYPSLYFNHHLTKYNEELLKEAIAKPEIKYAWFDNNHVYIRRNENEQKERITSKDQLDEPRNTSANTEKSREPPSEIHQHRKQQSMDDFVKPTAINNPGTTVINTHYKSATRTAQPNNQTKGLTNRGENTKAEKSKP